MKAIHIVGRWHTFNMNSERFRDRSMWFECPMCGKVIKNRYLKCPTCDVSLEYSDDLVGLEFQNYDDDNKTWVPDKYWSFLYTLEEHNEKC